MELHRPRILAAERKTVWPKPNPVAIALWSPALVSICRHQRLDAQRQRLDLIPKISPKLRYIKTFMG